MDHPAHMVRDGPRIYLFSNTLILLISLRGVTLTRQSVNTAQVQLDMRASDLA